MISLEMCQHYGISSEKELMTAIEELRKMGMPDIAIQAILDRSKTGSEEKNDKRRSKSKVDLLPHVRQEEMRKRS
jgi:hypothetical protein